MMIKVQMKALLFLVLVSLDCITCKKKKCVPATNPITDTSGRINSDALWKGPDCDHRWIFTLLPNNMTMLVINITKPPLMNDVIKLNGDDFVDDKKYCKILETKTRTLQDSIDTLQEIHRKFPGCKLRSGVQPGVVIAYNAGDGDFIKTSTDFVIEYSTVPVFPESTKPLETTTQSAIIPTTQASIAQKETTADLETSATTIRTTTGATVIPATSKMTLILAILGGSVFVLLILLTVALIVRQRRMKHVVSKDDLQLSSFYQEIPENTPNENDNGQIYNEISFVETRKKNTGGKNNNGPKVKREVSAKDVINPLYVSQSPGKHSYEYIEVKFPRRRQEERSAM